MDVFHDHRVVHITLDPFHGANDVAVHPAKREVLLGYGSTYTYRSKASPSPLPTVRRAFVHVPRLFGLGNYWKYSYRKVLLLIQSIHLSPVLMHLVYVISSHPSCGCSPVSFPVLCMQNAHQTCHPSTKHLCSTSTSARSPSFSNLKKSSDKPSSYLASTTTLSCQSLRICPGRPRQHSPCLCSKRTTPYLTLSFQVIMDPQVLTKQRSI